MIEKRKTTFYNIQTIERIPQLAQLSAETIFAMKVVGHVLPFRTNNYVCDDLIDWSRVPHDPMFQLTFPQRGMLTERQFDRMARALRNNVPRDEVSRIANEIRAELNPHPAGQKTANVPSWEGEPVAGLQHKYRETVLVFPSSGQTCHAYCTFCFRWPQFVGMGDLKFATDESLRFQDYIRNHKEITDVLVTGGDPMIMSAKNLRKYLEPFMGPDFAHVRTIRIGTKSVAYWPYRFVTDKDAELVLELFRDLVAAGKHLSIMGHHSHPVELETPVAQEAIRQIRSTGAQYRTQSPVIRHVNDDPAVWSRMWQLQVELGCVPYYMFVERDTGPCGYFEVPLVRTLQIYRTAIQNVSGLGRTVRGPSMSALPGKVHVDGLAEIAGEKVFVLSFLQARNPDWVRRPFFAKYDRHATWLDQLRPAFGESQFFFEAELTALLGSGGDPVWQNGRARETAIASGAAVSAAESQAAWTVRQAGAESWADAQT